MNLGGGGWGGGVDALAIRPMTNGGGVKYQPLLHSGFAKQEISRHMEALCLVNSCPNPFSDWMAFRSVGTGVRTERKKKK